MFYRSTKLLLASVFISGGLLLSSMVISGSSPAQPALSDFGSIAHPTNSLGLLNQCGEVFTFIDIPEELVGTIPEDYIRDPRGIPIPPMSVPAYGYMSNTEFDIEKGRAAQYQQKEVYSHAEIIRGLWEGVYIIWIGEDVSEEAFKLVQRYANEQVTPTIVLTWDLEKPIPRERQFAFSAWGTTQTCVDFEATVFENFIPYSELPMFDRDKENPPVASTDDDGKLHMWFKEK